MKRSIVVFLLLLGCGKESVIHRDTVDVPDAELPLEAPKTPESCPLSFVQAGVCAEVKWDAPATADVPGAFGIRFWKAGDAARSATALGSEPKTFFVMKCCKTPYAATLEKQTDGSYRVNALKLGPGEYWHYVQIGEEKLSMDVEVQ